MYCSHCIQYHDTKFKKMARLLLIHCSQQLHTQSLAYQQPTQHPQRTCGQLPASRINARLPATLIGAGNAWLSGLCAADLDQHQL